MKKLPEDFLVPPLVAPAAPVASAPERSQEDPTAPTWRDVMVHLGTYLLCGVGGFVVGRHYGPEGRKGLFASSGAVLGLAIANNSMNMYRELYMRERENA